MKKLSLRINATILSVMAIILILFGIYVGGVIESLYVDTLSNRLTSESAVMAASIEEAIHTPISQKDPQLESMVRRFAERGDVRITVIDRNGLVLSDSEAEPNEMDNHLNRPEVQEAMLNGKGYSVRYSKTLDEEMIYVAHVFGRDSTQGVVRLAFSLSHVNDFVHKLWFSLFLAMCAAIIIAALVSFWVSRYITKPIEEITSVAREITQKKFDSRVKIKTEGEIGQLARAINFMASSLETQMKEIKENEDKFYGVLDNMVSGVILIGKSRRILLVNSATEQFLGSKEKSLIGRHHIEAGMNFGLSQLIDRCFKTGEKMREEVHIYYPKERILDANLAPYKTEHGEVLGVVTVLHDITAIRRLEKMRSEFVANVSHELKTPITSIKGFAETLLDGAMEDRELLKEFLLIISHESDRLHRLINDILDLSKIEQKRLPLQITKVDVVSVLEEIHQTLQDKIGKKNLTFIFPEHSSVVIEADRDRLKQILINLIDNAIAYSRENGTIRICLEDQGEELMVSVIDNGIGIPQIDIHRIFERFYRVDKGRSRNSGGTGLGLAIVKHLVESHHGRIVVESEEGKGSQFMVYLPKVQY